MKRRVLLGALMVGLAACTAPSMPTRSAIETFTVPGAHVLGPYSQAVRAGDYVFLSGVIGFDAQTNKMVKAEIEPQTRQVFANISEILEAMGLGLNNVVKTSVYLRNPEDFGPMNVVYSKYFTAHKPARSTVPGVDWGSPDVLIEIEVVAYDPPR